MSARRYRRAALLAIAAFGLVAGAASADDRSIALRLQGERLVSEGRCPEAMALFAEVRARDPQDARAARLQGECAFQLRRYTEAIEPLESARRLDPAQPQVGLTLAMAHFHAGNLQAADRELEAVAPSLPDRAEVPLYRGLILLERAEHQEAAARLEEASALRRSDPVASYYAGLAWSAAAERDKSRAALRRVIDGHPGTVWASEAERALAQLDASQKLRRWARVTVGGEYDDNAVLRGAGVVLPSDISSDADLRGVWNAEVGSELFRNGTWAGGVLLGYSGTLHQDLDDFDLQYPVLQFWVDRRLTEDSFLRLSVDAGYAWVDTDPFLFDYGTTATYEKSWATAGTTRIFTRYARNNYLFGRIDSPPGPPFLSPAEQAAPGLVRNRDGNSWLSGIAQRYPVDEKTEVRVGYAYERYDARGREYSAQAHDLNAGVKRLLPWEFEIDLSGSFIYRPFRHSSTFPDPPGSGLYNNDRRHDRVWVANVVVERPIGENMSVAARYSWIDNQSNVDVFDYKREIIGLYWTVNFDN